jgi:hypothetical protein
MTRTRTCPECQSEFSYQVGSGTDRCYCTVTCRLKRRTRVDTERRELAKTCSTEGCEKKANRKNGLCEACYCYAWRTGRARDPKRKPYKMKTTAAGYRVLRVPGHPLANSNGDVSHHRLVAFATHSGICPPCYWCGSLLEWEGTHIDHLNDQKSDNRPENLVVSCPNCNRARGAMLPFFESLLPERFDQLLQLMRLCGQKRSSVA